MATSFSEVLDDSLLGIIKDPPRTQVNLDKSLTGLLFLADFGMTVTKPAEERIIEIEDKWVPIKLYAKNLKGTKIKRPLERNQNTVSGVTSYNFSVESHANGYIVNQLIYIDFKNYETLIPIDVNTGYCFVCQRYIVCKDKRFISHVQDTVHKKNVLECQLLPQHGIRLIRKFADKVHCGICNIICFEDQLDLHLSSREHEAEFNSALFVAKGYIKELDKKAVNATNSPSTSRDTEICKKSPQSLENNNYLQSKYTKSVAPEELSAKNTEPIQPELTYLYMDLKTGYLKISVDSWNTIIDNYRYYKYCVLCDENLLDCEIVNKHLRNPSHKSKLSNTGVIQLFGVHFIRQIREEFHCGVCNVIIHYVLLSKHITWDVHVKAVEENFISTIQYPMLRQQMEKKIMKIVIPPFQTQFPLRQNIDFHATIKRVDFVEKCSKPHKALILRDETLKIKWSHWNSIDVIKNGFKCLMCQISIKDKSENTILDHTKQQSHINSLTVFSKNYVNNLLRVIKDTKYNCMICNTELPKNCQLKGHFIGARHKHGLKSMQSDTSSKDIIVDHIPVIITLDKCI